VKIVMSDTGIGIPKSMLDRVFDKYKQVRQKDREMGTGLGLTICKNICQQHLGDITVESEEGKGSIFTVTLPQSLEMAQTAEGVSQTSAVQSILIVDDDADQTALLSSRLKKYNYNILSAKNGLEAIGLCQKILPDIVLLDLEMPIMNGLETLRRLMSLHGASTLPIIIHSSKITPENIELFRPNANDYIQKPAKLSELLGKIQQHIVRPKSKQNFEVSAPANILLIDDSEDIFALFKIYLKKTPHHLEYAASAEAGIKMLESKRFDIIFMDLNLPGMNGIEATAMLKQVGDENSGHFRVALLTAAHLDTVRAEAQKAGVDLVIEKKLSKEKILEYIEQLMAMDT
ncbi:MAG: response regulator, partial [Bdellovibrionota bacterium]